jgi:hypothetical protein
MVVFPFGVYVLGHTMCGLFGRVDRVLRRTVGELVRAIHLAHWKAVEGLRGEIRAAIAISCRCELIVDRWVVDGGANLSWNSC